MAGITALIALIAFADGGDDGTTAGLIFGVPAVAYSISAGVGIQRMHACEKALDEEDRIRGVVR